MTIRTRNCYCYDGLRGCTTTL